MKGRKLRGKRMRKREMDRIFDEPISDFILS